MYWMNPVSKIPIAVDMPNEATCTRDGCRVWNAGAVSLQVECVAWLPDIRCNVSRCKPHGRDAGTHASRLSEMPANSHRSLLNGTSCASETTNVQRQPSTCQDVSNIPNIQENVLRSSFKVASILRLRMWLVSGVDLELALPVCRGG